MWKKKFFDMQIYPYDGYIQILDHMIIVKLGNMEE